MATFEVVNQKEGNETVVKLVQFSTGQLNPDVQDSLRFKSFKWNDGLDTSNSRRKRKLEITTDFNGIQYAGQNYGLSNHFSTDSCDYYVAVHRKKAEKIQIYPAELFKLNPQLADTSKTDDRLQELSFREMRNSLISQFGSGQKQRQVKKRLEEKLDESVTSSIAQTVVKTANVDHMTPSVDSESSSTAIPPHVKTATTPSDAYPLDSLIPSWVNDAITEQSEMFIKATTETIDKWAKEKVYCPLILDLLSNVDTEPAKKKSQCSLIMYLHCLLYNFALKDFRKTDLFPRDWHSNVKQFLEEKFFVAVLQKDGKKKRSRPLIMKDLLLSHILLIYMRACNFSIKLKPLIAEIKAPLKRVILQCHMLGFRTKSVNKDMGETVAELVIPLVFPDSTKKAYKRK